MHFVPGGLYIIVRSYLGPGLRVGKNIAPLDCLYHYRGDFTCIEFVTKFV